MATLEIRVFPDPVLRRKARPVRRIDDAVRKLARDMIETMLDAGGAGLAANQVGVLQRVIALHMPEEEPRALVNPEITKREGEREVREGCLSVPGYVGLLTRSVRVTARALDEWGAKLRLTAEELLAQTIEHEVDHLNGILYLDHLKSHEHLWELGEDELHTHDVEYEVEADHSERPGEAEAVERLRSHASLSELGPDARLSDFAFDLSDGGRPDVARSAGPLSSEGASLDAAERPAEAEEEEDRE